jgi:uncharacterized membrane protein YdjX (TVP38/TMEM64 family)
VGFFLSIGALFIGPVVAYWFIRHAVYGAMKEFERWKRKQYGDGQYGRYDQYGEQP